MGALDIVWSLLGSNLKKATGRAHIDSPSQPIATGGGSRPYIRNPWKYLDSKNTANLKNRAADLARDEPIEELPEPAPELEEFPDDPHAGTTGVAHDWGEADYTRLFNELPPGVGDAIQARPRGPISVLNRKKSSQQQAREAGETIRNSVGVLSKIGETSSCPKCGGTRTRGASCPRCDPTSIE